MSSECNRDGSGVESVEKSLEICAPLVFQCAKCKTICADSFSFVCSHEDMGSITLSAASNIKRSPDVYTSKDGRDIGSTYYIFTCLLCDSNLGKYYLTTSKDLDEVREKFTFSISSVLAYHLGMSQHGKIPEPTLPSTASTEPVEIQANDTSLREEILKIQAVVLDIVQRITQLENQHRNAESSMSNESRDVKRRLR